MEFLRICGLNLYEAKVYFNLLKYGKVSRSEVYKISQIPQSRAYDILAALVDKDLVVLAENQAVLPQHPRRLLSADVYVDNKERLFRRSDALRKELKEIEFKTTLIRDEQQLLQSLTQMYDTPSAQHPIVRRFLDVFQKAEREILCLTSLPILYPSGQFYSEVLRAIGRGVVYRRILGYDYVLAQGAKSIAADAELGIRIRVLPEAAVEAKYYVVDTSMVFLRALKTTLRAESEEAFIFHQPEIVTAYRNSFDVLWERSEDLETFLNRVRTAISLRGEAQDILALVFAKGRFDRGELIEHFEGRQKLIQDLYASGILTDSEVKGLLIVGASALLG